MVEVFKTSIRTKKDAKNVLKSLKLMFPHYKINFDLEDCDNILRIETEDNMVNDQGVIRIVNSIGFQIEILVGEILNEEVPSR